MNHRARENGQINRRIFAKNGTTFVPRPREKRVWLDMSSRAKSDLLGPSSSCDRGASLQTRAEIIRPPLQGKALDLNLRTQCQNRPCGPRFACGVSATTI